MCYNLTLGQSGIFLYFISFFALVAPLVPLDKNNNIIAERTSAGKPLQILCLVV